MRVEAVNDGHDEAHAGVREIDMGHPGPPVHYSVAPMPMLR
jgi:hypothetical protein